MSIREDFKKTDKEKGEPAELELIEELDNFLIKKHNLNKGDNTFERIKTIAGDVLMTCNKCTYHPDAPNPTLFESKNDIKATDTGNIFIELSSRGENSGILASESHYWAIRFYFVDIENIRKINVFYIINKKRLLDGYLDKRYDRYVEGGDDDLNDAVLFKWEIFEEMVNEGIEANDGSMILKCANPPVTLNK